VLAWDLSGVRNERAATFAQHAAEKHVIHYAHKGRRFFARLGGAAWDLMGLVKPTAGMETGSERYSRIRQNGGRGVLGGRSWRGVSHR
jgi:hypothetical protein